MLGQIQSLLNVDNLSIDLATPGGTLHAVRNVSFSLSSGETLGIVGESGSGKSMTSLALMGLLPKGAVRTARHLTIADTDVMAMDDLTFARTMSGKRIAMIFQDPMTALNPVYTVGRQLTEQVVLDGRLTQNEANARAIDLLELTGVPAASSRMQQYPHALSGGLRQRVVISMMLMNEPELIIADEPTTALDVTVQAQILHLLSDLQKDRGMGMILITHDLGVISRIADKLAVMYAGEIIETGSTAEVLNDPQHPYTQGLLECMPAHGSTRRPGRLGTIPGIVPSLTGTIQGCAFANRCGYVRNDCKIQAPPSRELSSTRSFKCVLEPGNGREDVRNGSVSQHVAAEAERSDETVLRAQNVSCTFEIKPNIFSPKRSLRAVDDVSLQLAKGDVLAIVGESGCGKSTLARMLLGLQRPTLGTIELGSDTISALDPTERAMRIQPVFQDPFSSLNPRRTIGEAIQRPLSLHDKLGATKHESLVRESMAAVGLPSRLYNAYPNQISGGQRQRVAIARAIVLRPSILICDEPTSALDVSVQAQILNLLLDLRDSHGLSYVIVTHDLAVVNELATHVAVMYLGRVVEYGPASHVLTDPQHPYTKILLGSVMDMDVGSGVPQNPMKPGFPDAMNVPSGCRFHPRCPDAIGMCSLNEPPQIGQPDSFSACHLLASDAEMALSARYADDDKRHKS